MEWQWDQGALQLQRQIQQAGYACVIVGGAVRDVLRGQRPTDYDLATSADAATLAQLLPQAQPVAAEPVYAPQHNPGGDHDHQRPVHGQNAVNRWRMVSSMASMVRGVAADRFSQPSSVTRQLSSSRKPMPHSSW